MPTLSGCTATCPEPPTGIVSADDAENLSQLFQALAHPVRVQIVTALIEGPLCVADLLEALADYTQPNLSQHLATLRATGLVRYERVGQRVIYSLCCRQVKAIMGAARLSRCASAKAETCPANCSCKLQTQTEP